MAGENTAIEAKHFTKEQVALLARTIAKGATVDELSLFIGRCKQTGLDPFSRQIYFIKSGDRVMIQVSIDGFRVVAERSGKYAGQDEPVFTLTPDGAIEKCSVAVYRFGPSKERYQAAVGVAYMSEYHKPGGMWDRMPHTMLAKVAEALALRKAFPQDLSGLYSPEEMEQAGTVTQVDKGITVEDVTQAIGKDAPPDAGFVNGGPSPAMPPVRPYTPPAALSDAGKKIKAAIPQSDEGTEQGVE